VKIFWIRKYKCYTFKTKLAIMKKKDYEAIKALKVKQAKGETLTFAERNYLTMQTKRQNKKKK